MKPIATLLVALSIALPTVPALAAPGPGPQHAAPQGGPRDEPRYSPQHRPQSGPQDRPGQFRPDRRPDARQGPGQWDRHPPAPRVGQQAPRGSRVYQPPRHARLQPPPRGQEYRVHDGKVMLVDSRTAKVIAVLGLLSMLAS